LDTGLARSALAPFPFLLPFCYRCTASRAALTRSDLSPALPEHQPIELPGFRLVDLGQSDARSGRAPGLPQSNAVASLDVLSRSKPADSWRRVTAATVYRLVREGDELTSADIEVASTADRYWLVKIDQRGGGIGGRPPGLSAGWVPHRFVLASRGTGPFQLAYGSRDAKAPAFPIATLGQITRARRSSSSGGRRPAWLHPVSPSAWPGRRTPSNSAAKRPGASALTGNAGRSGGASCWASWCSAGWRSGWPDRYPRRRDCRLPPAPLGAHYLITRVDNTTTVTESDETNNCLASDSTVQGTAP